MIEAVALCATASKNLVYIYGNRTSKLVMECFLSAASCSQVYFVAEKNNEDDFFVGIIIY